MSGLLKLISLGMIFFLTPCLPAKAAEVPGLEALEREIVSNLSKVDEFEVLRQACTLHEMLKTEAWATPPQGVRALELSLTRARRYPGNQRSDPTLDDLLKIPGWRERPELISVCGGVPSERCLRQLLSEGKRFMSAIPCLVDGLSRHL